MNWGVIWLLAFSSLPSTNCSQVMTPNPECATVDSPIVDALHIMHDGKFLHLPVVDRGRYTTIILMKVHTKVYWFFSVFLYILNSLWQWCRWDGCDCHWCASYNSCSCSHCKSYSTFSKARKVNEWGDIPFFWDLEKTYSLYQEEYEINKCQLEFELPLFDCIMSYGDATSYRVKLIVKIRVLGSFTNFVEFFIW